VSVFAWLRGWWTPFDPLAELKHAALIASNARKGARVVLTWDDWGGVYIVNLTTESQYIITRWVIAEGGRITGICDGER